MTKIEIKDLSILFGPEKAKAKKMIKQAKSKQEILKETGTVFNGITLYKTGCIHGKPDTTMPYYKKFGFRPDAMGVVFKATGEKTVYLAGDTIWCDFVKNAVDKFAPEIIIVNAAAAQLIHSDAIIICTEDIAGLRG